MEHGQTLFPGVDSTVQFPLKIRAQVSFLGEKNTKLEQKWEVPSDGKIFAKKELHCGVSTMWCQKHHGVYQHLAITVATPRCFQHRGIVNLRCQMHSRVATPHCRKHTWESCLQILIELHEKLIQL